MYNYDHWCLHLNFCYSRIHAVLRAATPKFVLCPPPKILEQTQFLTGIILRYANVSGWPSPKSVLCSVKKSLAPPKELWLAECLVRV